MSDIFNNDDNNGTPSGKSRIILWVVLAMPIVVALLGNALFYKGTFFVTASHVLLSILPSVTHYLYLSHTYIW